MSKNQHPELPEDILIYAARMFLPNIPDLDMNRMIRQAICELRDFDWATKTRQQSLAEAMWQASDPVCIANYTMMFVKPQLAWCKEYHEWHGKLLKLKKERLANFEDAERSRSDL